MSIVKGTLSVVCSNCGKQHDFSADEADFEPNGGDERQMGAENGCSWEYTFECDSCNNEIEIEYEVWEYPVGAFNNDQVNIKGGTEKGRFDYDFHGDDSDDY